MRAISDQICPPTVKESWRPEGIATCATATDGSVAPHPLVGLQYVLVVCSSPAISREVPGRQLTPRIPLRSRQKKSNERLRRLDVGPAERERERAGRETGSGPLGAPHGETQRFLGRPETESKRAVREGAEHTGRLHRQRRGCVFDEKPQSAVVTVSIPLIPSQTDRAGARAYRTIRLPKRYQRRSGKARVGQKLLAGPRRHIPSCSDPPSPLALLPFLSGPPLDIPY